MNSPQLRFLIVDDQAVLLRAMTHLVMRHGAHDVMVASDGQAALEILKDSTQFFDIIISDLHMPGMDGMEFMRHLGALDNKAWVILCSSMDARFISSVETMSKAYGVNFLGLVEKPLTAVKLQALLSCYQGQPTQNSAKRVDFSIAELMAGLKNNEFEPFFQPKIDIKTGKVTGAEALARWRHPDLGIVAPSEFIDLFEQNNKIDDLTFQMIAKATRACHEWHVAGHASSVSINVSVSSLRETIIAQYLHEAVAQAHLRTGDVIVEVTESTAMTEVGPVLENLTRLRMHGFGLSIDDYGTGYSSMQQLLRIPFTELKIDQSFVSNVAHDEITKAIVESSVNVSKKLGLKVVAEGVETYDAVATLKLLNCDMAQGYLYAKPMDGATYLKWLAQSDVARANPIA